MTSWIAGTVPMMARNTRNQHPLGIAQTIHGESELEIEERVEVLREHRHEADREERRKHRGSPPSHRRDSPIVGLERLKDQGPRSRLG